MFKAPLPPLPPLKDPRKRPPGLPPLPSDAKKKPEMSAWDRPPPKTRSKSPEAAKVEKQARDPKEFGSLGSVKLIEMFHCLRDLLVSRYFPVPKLVGKGFLCHGGSFPNF